MRVVLITMMVLVAVSAMDLDDSGRRDPDPKRARIPAEIFSPHEILEAVVRHSLPDPFQIATIALINKSHLDLVRDVLRLCRIIVQMPSSRSTFIDDIKWLITVCRAQPFNGAAMRSLLTEDTAPLLLNRLLSIVLDHTELVADLFDVIAPIESVAQLTPGWIALIDRYFWLKNLAEDHPVMRMRHRVLSKTPPASVTISDIPADILNVVRSHQSDSILGDLPDPFATIDPYHALEVKKTISRHHQHQIRSQPVLARRLLFLGTPVLLSEMKIADLTAADLRALLPFVFYVELALTYQIDDLIASGHSDHIEVILRSEAFIFPAFSPSSSTLSFLADIVCSLIKAEGQHNLLRLLLEAPLPNRWVADVGSWQQWGGSILHYAVKEGNAGAVRVLLEFPDLISTSTVDEHGLTARSYAQPGSVIDSLFY